MKDFNTVISNLELKSTKKCWIVYEGVSIRFLYNDSTTFDYLYNLYSPTIQFLPYNSQSIDVEVNMVFVSSEYLVNLQKLLKKYQLTRIILHGGKDPEFYSTGLSICQDKQKLILIEETGSIIFVNTKKQVYIFSDSSKCLRVDTERVLMDILGRGYESQNQAFHFHSSAAKLPESEQCILFIGNKNAGKTTFLTHLLLNYNCDYLSNDNNFVFVDANHKIAKVKPWGYYYKIKEATIMKYPKLYKQIKDDKSVQISNDHKYKLFTYKMLQLFQVDFTPSAELGFIVFLNYNPHTGTHYRLICNETEYYTMLNQHVYVPHDPEHYNFLGIYEEFGIERLEHYRQLKSFLYKNIPMYEFVYSDQWEQQFWAFYNDEIIKRRSGTKC